MHLEIGQIITQIISFLVMLWVLKRYAWKPLLSTLEERKKAIRSEFDNIEKQKKNLEKQKKEYEGKLHDIDEYAHVKIEEAVDIGRKRADEIHKEAQQNAQALLTKTQADLQKEVIKAKEQLKDEIVKMTMMSTEKILQKDLNKDKQKGLIQDFVEQV